MNTRALIHRCKLKATLLLAALLAVASNAQGAGAYNGHYHPGLAATYDADNITFVTYGPAYFQVYINASIQENQWVTSDHPSRFGEFYLGDGNVRRYTVFGPSGLVYQEDFVSGACIGCAEQIDGGQETVINRTIVLEDVPYQPPPTAVVNYKCSDDKVGGTQSGCQSCKAPPMAEYSVHSMLVSLNIRDNPLRYTPPIGPAINFTVTYNQRESQQLPIFSYANLGPKWTHNWFAYLVDDPHSQLPITSVYLPGGGVEMHRYDAVLGFVPDPQSHTVLFRVNLDRYERRLPDGSKQIFSKGNGTSVYPRKLFMTEVVDATNNRVLLTYDGNYRIKKITDALNQETNIFYNEPGDLLKISRVEDPFGRSASFHYADGKLSYITDEVGIESHFHYSPGTDSIDSLTTPYGTTTFASGQSGTNRWIEITDPLLPVPGKERVEYRDSGGIANTEPVAPNAPGIVNANLDVANTFFWDKKAMSEAPGNYTKAQVKHWLFNTDGTISGILSSEKKALENRVWYTYLNQPDHLHVGSNARPSQVAQVLGDNSTQLYQYQYNDFGKVIEKIDPKGRITDYAYDSNQIDLHEIQQRTATGYDVVRRFEDYMLHQPQTELDAAGQLTRYVYNGYGQLTSRRNARQEVSTYTYGIAGPGGGTVPPGYLASIISPQFNSASTSVSFSYDEFNRIRTVTDNADGYTMTIEYDNIDRKTRVTYPDLSFEEFEYVQDFGQGPKTILDLTRSRDRLGRWTTRHYNQNRQMDSIIDPLLRETQYEWCSCGSLTRIIDGNHQPTTFLRDLQSRVYQKVFADMTAITYLYDGQLTPNTSGATSRLESSTDARNRRTRYVYNRDGNISDVNYTDGGGGQLVPPTPSVHFTYDDYYNRVNRMNDDGLGETIYGYHDAGELGAGQLESVNGPFQDDTIVYAYDELGRVHSQAINGVAEEVDYDSLGRLDYTVNALDGFTREYEGLTSRLHKLYYPHTQDVTYTYHDNNEDRRLQSIQNATTYGYTNLSTFEYTYDDRGQITSCMRTFDKKDGRWFNYNAAGELEDVQDREGHDPPEHAIDFNYDPAGNRTNDHTYGSKDAMLNHDYTPNTVNQITSITTTVNNGPPSESVLTYDLAGNMTADGGHMTFEWDAASRLSAINYTDSGQRTEMVYDGLGRRAKIVEYGPGVTAIIEPQRTEYGSYNTAPIALPAGSYAITFQALDGGDDLVLIDSVSLTSTVVANRGFEVPDVGSSPGRYEYNPSGATWSFAGQAGIAHNGSDLTSHNPDAPKGEQVGFVQGTGSILQTHSISAGTYSLSFLAAQGANNSGSQRIRVTLRPSIASAQVKTFLWCGTSICEERDSTGATVTKRFFEQGEQRVGGPDAGNYYYSRDHLGSIREVTNSKGFMTARYDYDPYGNQVVLDGTMTVDFGYTGHYFHAPSGLNLTLYRAYNPALGRWLSRDPIGEAAGINLYGYIGNDPLNRIDKLGLYEVPPEVISVPLILRLGVPWWVTSPWLWPAYSASVGLAIGNIPAVRDFVDRQTTNLLYNSDDDDSTWNVPDPNILDRMNDLQHRRWEEAYDRCQEDWKSISSGCNVTRENEIAFMKQCMEDAGF